MSNSFRILNILRRASRTRYFCSSAIRLKHITPLSASVRSGGGCRSQFQRLSQPSVINTRCYASDSDLPTHIKVPLPALSPTMEMGTLVSWEKKEGDQLNEGDLLAEIETDKATMGFETPEEGYLAKILVPAGQRDIPIGKLLCIIVSNKEDIEAFKDFKDTGELIKSGGGPPPPAAAPPKPAAAAPPPPPPPTPAGAPPPAPVSAPRVPPAGGARVFASPLARRLAAEGGIDLRMVQGSGPGGRVKSQDLAGAPMGGAVGPASAGFQDLPLDHLMQARVQQLVESKQTVPHYYLSAEAEVGDLLRVRDQLNSMLEKEAVSISLTDLVVKAAALACVQIPAANSSWQGTFIRQYSNVNISVAVNTPDGTLTPVIYSAETKGLRSLSQEIKSKVQEGKVHPQDLQGATFSVSDVGSLGVGSYSPIILPPLACSLAIGSLSQRMVPCSKDGHRAAQFLTVTLSCDHRVVDGAVGAQWLAHLRKLLEQPQAMLL